MQERENDKDQKNRVKMKNLDGQRMPNIFCSFFYSYSTFDEL